MNLTVAMFQQDSCAAGRCGLALYQSMCIRNIWARLSRYSLSLDVSRWNRKSHAEYNKCLLYWDGINKLKCIIAKKSSDH